MAHAMGSIERSSEQQGVRALLLPLVQLPPRLWALLIAVHLGIAAILPPIVTALFEGALHVADLRALTDQNLLVLAGTPGSVALLAAAGALIAAASVGWAVLAFVVAERRLAGEASRGSMWPRLRVAAGMRRAWPLAIGMAVAGPLAGITVFAPASAVLAVPPFIGREFLKDGLSGALWSGIIGALLVVTAAAILALPALMLELWPKAPRDERWARRRDERRTAIALVVVAAIVALLPRAAAFLLETGQSGLRKEPETFAGQAILAWALYQLVSVFAAQAIAFLVVARARLAAGLEASAIGPAPVRWRRVRIRVVAVTGVLALVGTGALTAGASQATSALPEDPLLIAHRGYDNGGPENTIAALEAAAEFDPDYVEVDVQQTADGDYVASHDVNLTVLAGRNENIYEMTTAEVLQTTVSMHGRADTIPTMTEYVERARELGIPLMIELKITGHETRDPVDELLAELDAIGGTKGNVFHSLDRASVEKLKQLRPDLRVGLTVAINVGKLPDVGNDFYVVEQASITPEMIDWAHARGLPIYAWTVNDRMAMDALLAAGIDGLVTDQLDEAVPLISDAGG